MKLVEFSITVEKRLRFNLMPKLHYLHHVVHELSTSGNRREVRVKPATPSATVQRSARTSLGTLQGWLVELSLSSLTIGSYGATKQR